MMNNEILKHDDVVGALAVIETVFRSYRDQLVETAGNVSFSEKDDKSVVTELDLEVEKATQSAMVIEYPNLPVYGEETGYGEGNDSAFWLIDPIDGTSSFIKGLPTFSNMAALIENGETRAAIIYNPVRNDIYTAIKGQGTFKNGVQLDITTINPDNLVLCKDEFADDIIAMLASKNMRTVSPPSGGGDGFTQLLDGIVAARFQMPAHGYAHDYAPGALLVLEAGGVIIPIKDDIYTYESQSFVACHPMLKDILRQNVSKLREMDR